MRNEQPFYFDAERNDNVCLVQHLLVGILEVGGNHRNIDMARYTALCRRPSATLLKIGLVAES